MSSFHWLEMVSGFSISEALENKSPSEETLRQLLEQALSILEVLDTDYEQQPIVHATLMQQYQQLLDRSVAKRATANGRFQNLSVGGTATARTATIRDTLCVGGKIISPKGEAVVSRNNITKNAIARWKDSGLLTNSAPTISDDGRIQNVAEPQDDSDVATRKFVQENSALDAKGSVKAMGASTATGEPVSVFGNTFPSGVPDISLTDGIELTADATPRQRVLLVAETYDAGGTKPAGYTNGVWEVNSGEWTRPTDFKDGQVAAASYVFIRNGDRFDDTGWLCTNAKAASTIGSDALSFTQFSASGVTTVGTFDNAATDDGLTISAKQVLTLHAASQTHPGAVSTGAQTFGGTKTFADQLSAGGGIVVSGTVTFDAGGNNAQLNAATQTSSATVTIPNLNGNSGNIVIDNTSQTLTGKTLSSPTINTPVLNGSGGQLTLPAGADTLVGRNTTDTLANKTLSSPIINTPELNGSGGQLTLPAGADTLVGRNTTDTLANKTLSSPTINNPSISVGGGQLTLPNGPDTVICSQTAAAVYNKTLYTPKIDTINDTNGNAIVQLSPASNAVNSIRVTNAASGASPAISTQGSTTTNLVLSPGSQGFVSSSRPFQFSTSNGGPDGTLNVVGAPISTTPFKMISGKVNADGTPFASSIGFTSTRTLSGRYRLVWDVPFSTVPALVLTPLSNVVMDAVEDSGRTNNEQEANISIMRPGSSSTDAAFSFVAIGQGSTNV